MDTMTAFMMGDANRGKPQKVFDWDKAATLIATSGVSRASAGLAEDWGSTSGEILDEGKPVDRDDTYVYLASTWATPVLVMGHDEEECWTWQTGHAKDWDAHTYWPESAVAILSAAKDKQD